MRKRRQTAFLLFNLFVIAFLLGLGVWQLQRLEWKRDLLHRISERLAAEPVELGEVRQRQERGDDVEYLRAAATGRFQQGREQYLFTSRGGVVGWQVVVPFVAESGATVLIDRGFVPDRLKDPMSRPEGQREEPLTVTGVVRTHADDRSLFAPSDEPQRGVWYSWSPERMGRNAGLGEPLTFILHAEPAADGAEWPKPERVGPSSIPNNHLQYALTWFGLALILIVLTLYQFRRVRAS